MRLLCASDLHADGRAAGRILELIDEEKIDMYLDAGDLHSSRFAQDFLSRMKVRTLVSPGNADIGFTFDNGTVTATNFGIVKHRGYHFLIVGNRFPQDFVTEALALTRDVPPDKLIFLSHYPPHMGLDLMWTGISMGFPPFRTFDEIKQPLLHIFGHIHEARGVDNIGRTTLVNCSVSGNGRAYIIDLPGVDITDVSLV